MTYEKLNEKTHRLGYLVSLQPPKSITSEKLELIKLQKLRKTYPEYQDEQKKTEFLLYLLQEA